MNRIDLVALAQQHVSEIVREGNVVIDATLGNRVDAFFLAQLVGGTGHSRGRSETKEVKAWALALESAGYTAELIIAPNLLGNAPELLAVRRTGPDTNVLL